MSDSPLIPKLESKADILIIRGFREDPDLVLNIAKINEGESRLHEAQVVNPATYANLEFTYGEGYREAKRHVSALGYAITRAEKTKEDIKSVLILDHYNDFLKEKKMKDNSTVRDAYLQRNKDYVDSINRIDQLKALERLIEGKIKVFENTCRYMKKQMDLTIRSGINTNKY